MSSHHVDLAVVRHAADEHHSEMQVRRLASVLPTTDVFAHSSHADSANITAARKQLSMFGQVFEHIEKASHDDRFPKLDTTEFSQFLGFNVNSQHDIGDYIDAFGSKLSEALKACEQGKQYSWVL